MLHAWHDVSPGNELPQDFQAVIEIPLGSNVKYELDKPTGLLKATNDPEFNSYVEARELPPHRLLVLKRFFLDYKQLEGKQVQVDDIRPRYAAVKVIEKALARYQKERKHLRAKDGH